MNADKHIRLATEALQMKKAWLMAAALVGGGDQMTPNDYLILNYLASENKWLKRYIQDLKDDWEDIAKHLFLHWRQADLSATSLYLAKKYDDWQEVRFGLFDIGRVHEIEREVGLLSFRKRVDCPPYSQIVLQGFFGAGIRHPEYHLATDLALLYNLFLDSQDIMDQAARQKRLHSSEYNQSLGRSVILTCFNLLESFVSGLAVAFLLENPNTSAEMVKKLEDKNLSLRRRLLLFPSLITRRPGVLDDAQPPILPLFGECKERRDSFVHCEPGPTPTKWGYVKEEHFHDVSLSVVRKTVDLTCETICLVWKVIHGREKPTWLPMRDASGRFRSVQVCLRSLES